MAWSEHGFGCAFALLSWALSRLGTGSSGHELDWEYAGQGIGWTGHLLDGHGLTLDGLGRSCTWLEMGWVGHRQNCAWPWLGICWAGHWLGWSCAGLSMRSAWAGHGLLLALTVLGMGWAVAGWASVGREWTVWAWATYVQGLSMDVAVHGLVWAWAAIFLNRAGLYWAWDAHEHSLGWAFTGCAWTRDVLSMG